MNLLFLTVSLAYLPRHGLQTKSSHDLQKGNLATNPVGKQRFQNSDITSDQRLVRSAAAALILVPLLGLGTVLAPPDGDVLRDGALEGPAEGAADAGEDRFCAMCALTRWPAARAAHRAGSAAKAAPPMMRARRLAFSQGGVGCDSWTPSLSSIVAWGSRMVPPPKVPTSIDGMETEI
jgi:hypothetical protein